MPKTRLISPGSIPNHRLLKNLQLQDNYISNDGGDEGIRITDDGLIKIASNIEMGQGGVRTGANGITTGSLRIGTNENDGDGDAWPNMNTDAETDAMLSIRNGYNERMNGLEVAAGGLIDNHKYIARFSTMLNAQRMVIFNGVSQGTDTAMPYRNNGMLEGRVGIGAFVTYDSQAGCYPGQACNNTPNSGSSNPSPYWAPVSLVEVRGATAIGGGGATVNTNTDACGVLTISTGLGAIEDDVQLGRIDFRAPLESSGTSAILPGASIWGEAEDTFASDNNSTALVFATATNGVPAERMRIDKNGYVSFLTYGAAGGIHVFDNESYILKSDSDTDDYFKLAVTTDGIATFSTVDDTGNNQAKMVFSPQGDVIFTPAANNEMKATITTKTASSTSDSTFRLTEELDLPSGAGGSDVHYGIWYSQTQTNLAGWNNVYLMYLDGGNKFIVDKDAQLTLDINDSTASGSSSNKGIHIDIDNSGTNDSSGTLTSTGLDLDITTIAGHATSTANQVGLDLDSIVHPSYNGTSTNIGLDIYVAGGDTNYAIITDGGNVGIGVSAPDQALEVNGDIHVENTVYFTAETANTIADGATGTIDWNTSQKQKVTITGTGITCNFTDPAGPCNLLLKVVQGDGSDVIATWDGDIKWPTNDTVPTLSTGNGDIDIISFYFDGTNYFGVATLDFA